MPRQEFILDLSLEAHSLLADNGVDLVAELRGAGIQATRGGLPSNIPVPAGGKEPVLTVLAIGVSASLLATAVTKILDALGRNKKFLASEHELAPVTSRSGEIVRDASGTPVLYWSERKRLIEAKQTSQDQSTSALETKVGPFLIKFATRSGK